ncbi:hypothetical protein ACJX0J_006954 [Zea mays]
MTVVRLKWSKEGGLCSQHFVTAPITSLKFLVWFCLLLLSITTLLSFSFIYLCRLEFRGTLNEVKHNHQRDVEYQIAMFILYTSFLVLSFGYVDSEGLYTARSNTDLAILVELLYKVFAIDLNLYISIVKFVIIC